MARFDWSAVKRGWRRGDKGSKTGDPYTKAIIEAEIKKLRAENEQLRRKNLQLEREAIRRASEDLKKPRVDNLQYFGFKNRGGLMYGDKKGPHGIWYEYRSNKPFVKLDSKGQPIKGTMEQRLNEMRAGLKNLDVEWGEYDSSYWQNLRSAEFRQMENIDKEHHLLQKEGWDRFMREKGRYMTEKDQEEHYRKHFGHIYGFRSYDQRNRIKVRSRGENQTWDQKWRKKFGA